LKKRFKGVRKLLFFGALAVVLCLAAVTFFVYSKGWKLSQVKALAEDKLGSYLGEKVHIGHIKFGFFEGIALEDLSIERKKGDNLYYLMDVGRMEFKYPLKRIFNSELEEPTSVTLDSPNFVFKSLAVPFAFLNLEQSIARESPFVNEVAFREGRIRFDLPSYPLRFDLQNIRGKLKKKNKGVWKVAMLAELDQAFEGTLEANGEIDDVNQTVRLVLDLGRLRAKDRTSLPIRDIRGKIVLTESDLFFEGVEFKYRNTPMSINGRINGYSKRLSDSKLEINVGADDEISRFTLNGNLERLQIEGEYWCFGEKVPVRANVQTFEKELVFEDLWIAEHNGQGSLDLEGGAFQMYLERNQQRIDFGGSVVDWKLEILFQGAHVNFFGTDLVTRSRFKLAPDRDLWAKNRWAFDGSVVSEYLIMNQVPFPDFKGTFHVADGSVQDMKFEWAEGFELSGSMGLMPPYAVDADISLTDIKLSELRTLFARPLPASFQGVVSGEVNIRGNQKSVEAEGSMTIKKGHIGSFEYDQVWLNFYGIPPYLKLKESTLKKWKRTFRLKGEINLEKQNIFENIEITSPERIVVWQGSELSNKKPDSGYAREQQEAEKYRLLVPKIEF